MDQISKCWSTWPLTPLGGSPYHASKHSVHRGASKCPYRAASTNADTELCLLSPLLSTFYHSIFYLLCQLLSSCRDFLPWITLTSMEGGSECPWDFGDCCLDCYFGGCCAGHMTLVTLFEDEGSQRWSRQSPELWRDAFLSLLSRTASLGTHENYRYFSVL